MALMISYNRVFGNTVQIAAGHISQTILSGTIAI